MAVEVRAIQPEELAGWVETMHLGFHADGQAAEEAAFRRDVLQQDLGRTLAAVEGQRIAGTLMSFPAELTLPGGTSLTADAVGAVTVQPTHRRRGLLTQMLRADLSAARERGEVASILIAAEYPIYGRFGFGPATEQAEYTLQRAAARFTCQSQGNVELLEPAHMREVAPLIFDRFRRDRPGQIDRPPTSWDIRLRLREAPWNRDQKPPRCAVFTTPDGQPEGYLLYRAEGHWDRHLPIGRLEVVELIALSRGAYVGLWRYCCDVDLIKEIEAGMRPVYEPLAWLLDNPRAALRQTMRADLLWLRPLDLPRTLAARRYLCEGRLVIEVNDPLAMCGGRYALEGGPSGATCRATTEAADLSMGMPALGAITLGGVSLQLLAEAGAIEEQRPGAITAGERLFRWPVTPWCSTFF
jgi:predicted acetyltransferase